MPAPVVAPVLIAVVNVLVSSRADSPQVDLVVGVLPPRTRRRAGRAVDRRAGGGAERLPRPVLPGGVLGRVEAVEVVEVVEGAGGGGERVGFPARAARSQPADP